MSAFSIIPNFYAFSTLHFVVSVYVLSHFSLVQLFVTFNFSPPVSSVHEGFPAKNTGAVAVSSSRGSS